MPTNTTPTNTTGSTTNSTLSSIMRSYFKPVTTNQIDLAEPRPPLPDRPLTLLWGGREVFVMRKDGTITADWGALMRLKDRLFSNACADASERAVCTQAAALWLARNT